MHRERGIDVQTIWYRAPEVCRKKGEFGTAIDMWSLGCIMAELCGQTFHQLRNMSHQQMLTQYAKDWACIEAMGRSPWPAVVRVKIGTVGEYLLDALLSVEATSRPSAREAVGHQFLHPTRMIGHSVYRSDDKGLRGFLPAASCDRLPGERHPYILLRGNVGVEVLAWLPMAFMGEDTFRLSFHHQSLNYVMVEEDSLFILACSSRSLAAPPT